MDKHRRAQVRNQMSELASLLNQWDPAELISAGAPADEYECLVGPLLARLSEGRSPAELGEWLSAHVTDHFDLCKDTEPFARRVTDWYRRAQADAV
jgi:hypothetical protein